MVEYTKPWLSLERQIEELAGRGVSVGDRPRAVAVLKSVGYYRITGYLYPFRESEQYVDSEGHRCIRVLGNCRTGTTLDHAQAIIDFDRLLRMIVYRTAACLPEWSMALLQRTRASTSA